MRNALLAIFFISVTTIIFAQTKNSDFYLNKYKQVKSLNANFDSAEKQIIAYTDSLAVSYNNKSIVDIAYYNLVLSELHSNLGTYNKAIEYSKDALKEYKILKDTIFLIYTYSNIGVIYGSIEEYEIAEIYFQHIDTIHKTFNNENLKYHNYINLGIVNIEKNPDLTLEYFYKAKEYFTLHTEKSPTLVGLLNNIALVYKRTGKYTKAIKLFKENLNTIDSSHVYYSSLTSNIAATYLLANNLDSALCYVYPALYNPTSVQYLNNYVNYYRILTKAYIKKNEVDSASKYFELFIEFKDSIALENEAKFKSKLNVVYETDKLIENINIQKVKIDKYKQQLIFSIIIAIMIAAVLILFFFQYRKLRFLYRNIVKESVQSIKYEEENVALLNKLNIIENNSEEKPQTDLNIENSEDIFDNIKLLVCEQKLFTNKDFDLNMLSEKLDTNRTYISNIINSKTGDSFVTFINLYRVKEAKKLLIDEQNKILTLDAIGSKAGFSSTSTFNRVFKAETGVTPSFYAKNKL